MNRVNPLPGGNGNPAAAGHLSHSVKVVRTDGVFQEHGVIGFQAGGQLHRQSRLQPPVELQAQIHLLAYGLPDFGDSLLRLVEHGGIAILVGLGPGLVQVGV